VVVNEALAQRQEIRLGDPPKRIGKVLPAEHRLGYDGDEKET